LKTRVTKYTLNAFERVRGHLCPNRANFLFVSIGYVTTVENGITLVLVLLKVKFMVINGHNLNYQSAKFAENSSNNNNNFIYIALSKG